MAKLPYPIAFLTTAFVLAHCVFAQLVSAQDPATAIAQFDVEEYVSAVPTADLREWLKGLGNVPSLNSLEARYRDAAKGAALSDGHDLAVLAEIEGALASARSGDFGAALASARDSAEHWREALGPEHCLTQRLESLADEFSSYSELSDSQRAALAQAFVHEQAFVEATVSGNAGVVDSSARAYLSIVASFLPEDHFRVTDARLRLGQALGASGEALILNSVQRLYARNPSGPATLSSLLVLARHCQLNGRLSEARTLALAALDGELVCGLPLREEPIALLNTLGVIESEQYELARADRLLTLGLTLARTRTAVLTNYVTAFLTNLSANHLRAGKHAAAVDVSRQAYARSIELSGERSPQTLLLGSNLALALEAAGSLRESESILRSSLAFAPDLHGDDSAEVALIRNNLGHVLYRLRELDEAEILLRRSLQYYESQQPQDQQALARQLDSLAGVLEARGDVDLARPLLEKALELRMKLGGENSPAVAESLFNLGLLSELAGDRENSIAYLRRSLELRREALPAQHPETLTSLAQLGHALHLDGQLEEAAGYFAESARFESLLKQVDLWRSIDQRRMRATFELDRGNLAMGEELLRTVLADQLEARGPAHPELAVTWIALGNAAMDGADTEHAVECFRNAFDIVDQHRGRVLGAEVERGLYAKTLRHGQLARTLAIELTRANRPGEALIAAERGRGRVLLDLLARSSDEDGLRGHGGNPAAVPAGDDTLAALRSRSRPTVGEPSPSGDPQASSATPLNALFRSDKLTLEALRTSWPAASVATLEEIRSGLSPQDLILSFTWHSDALAVQLISPDAGGATLGSVISAGERFRALRARCRAAAAALATDPRARSEPLDITGLIGELLPAPILDRMRKARRVIAIPDGPLESLPLEPLLWPSEQNPHIELAYASSATLFLNRRQQPVAPSDSAATRTAVVLGDPHFDSSAVAGNARAKSFEQLPGTRREALAVAQLLGASGYAPQLLLDERASLVDLERNAVGAGLIHLATHGQSGSQARPYDASLVLSGVEEGPSSLTLDRLIGTWKGRLNGTSLVVLSACDTQRGVPAGDSRLALPWGFFYSGAKSVIASLWKVDDRAATFLMARLYENLLGKFDDPRAIAGREFQPGEPLNRSAALAEAKQWLRSATRAEIRARTSELELGDGAERSATRGGDSRKLDSSALRPYSDPYFWAGFLLLGDPGD